MGKITFILFTIVVLFAAIVPAKAQEKEETRQVSGFSDIVCDGPFTVHVKMDGTESLKIKSEPDVIKVIETTVQNGILTIKFKDNLQNGQGNSDGPMDIFVTAKSLSSVLKVGSGSIDIDGAITGNDASIVINGSGNIHSSVKAINLKLTVNGLGLIVLKGNTNNADITINGPGGVSSRELQADNASVIINGAGNVSISADKSVSARLAGAGSVIYSGDATVIDSKIVGTGKLSKAD